MFTWATDFRMGALRGLPVNRGQPGRDDEVQLDDGQSGHACLGADKADQRRERVQALREQDSAPERGGIALVQSCSRKHSTIPPARSAATCRTDHGDNALRGESAFRTQSSQEIHRASATSSGLSLRSLVMRHRNTGHTSFSRMPFISARYRKSGKAQTRFPADTPSSSLRRLRTASSRRSPGIG
jgi:hypothetical protein